jgi:hypothetical protein
MPRPYALRIELNGAVACSSCDLASITPMIESPPTMDASQTISRSSLRKKVHIQLLPDLTNLLVCGGFVANTSAASDLDRLVICFSRTADHWYDLPILAFENPLQSSIKQLAIRRGHVKPKGIVVTWH